MSEEEIKAKRLKIQKSWESLGFTEGLQGGMIESLAKLFESEAKALKDDSESK